MITHQDDNAFPSETIANGLSKREYFAIHIMAGFSTGTKAAVHLADELIKALNEQEIK